jgi:ribosomal-protein-alanine N-acetyltransferase
LDYLPKCFDLVVRYSSLKNHIDELQIKTNRFILRTLTVSDVNDRYVSWLTSPTINTFIENSRSNADIDSIRNYVLERVGRRDVVFMGIFEKVSGQHIGNIKYEPVDQKTGDATVGILIGEQSWWGVGAAGEVLAHTALHLYADQNISNIKLGVHKLNKSAIKAYKKIGFQERNLLSVETDKPQIIEMEWNLLQDNRFIALIESSHLLS